MSRYRFFILPRAQRWTIRCASRRIGRFGDPAAALTTALEVASFEVVRGHAAEVLHQDAEGRWLRATSPSTTVWRVRADGVTATRA